MHIHTLYTCTHISVYTHIYIYVYSHTHKREIYTLCCFLDNYFQLNAERF